MARQEKNDTVSDAERDRDQNLTEIAQNRSNAMTGHLIWLLVGLGSLVAGIVLIVKTVRDNSISDTEIDWICANYVKNNLKPMALKKLGIDEDQVKEVAPIQFHGYYFYCIILA